MLQVGQHYPPAVYIRSGQVTQQQQEVLELIDAMDEGDVQGFSELLQQVDLNTYFDYENTQVLVSCFLLGYAVNPDMEEGEIYIRQILDKKPDLTMPVMKVGYEYANLKEAILEAQKDLKEKGAWLYPPEAIETIFKRMQLVLDYLEQNS